MAASNPSPAPAAPATRKHADPITKHILEVAKTNKDDLSPKEVQALHAKAMKAALASVTPRAIAEVKLESLQAAAASYQKRLASA